MFGRSWTVVALVAGFALIGCRTGATAGVDAQPIKVVRVQNPSDDRSGAEHCAAPGGPCRPLAPGQEIERKGLVRTFAGSSVTLDLGHGRLMDLGPLSETVLSVRSAELKQGEMGVSGTALITKEPASTFDFVVGRRTFNLDQARSSLANFAVSGDTTGVTVRHGRVQGADVDGLSAGDTVRLTSVGAFRTSPSGGELAALPYVGSARRTWGDLWPESIIRAPRGLGTMTGRVPNTERVLGGVRLAKHRAIVTIVDGLARTEIVEEFENQTEQILEGRFRFPVPSDAAVSRLGLWVGDELVEGEVVEATRARAIYESIVDRPVPRDPALLEWVSAGEMSLKVFPILPKNSRRLLLAYDQLLPAEGGRFRYTYPLSLGEGRDNTISELSISVHVLDTAGDIESLRVPSHDARTLREGPWTSAYFSARDVTLGRDFVVVGERRLGTYLAVDMPGAAELAPPAEPDAPVALRRDVPPETGLARNVGHFALRAGVDLPQSIERPHSIRADRALVLDVSYSQSRETVRAQAALALAIVSELEPEEGFVLLACDSACAVHSAPATGAVDERRERARSFLLGLAPGGASDLAGALVAGAVELGRLPMNPDKSRQLVLLSDGQSTAGELSAASIARVASRYLTPANVDLRLIGAGRKLDRGQLENLAIELDAALDYLPSAVELEQRVFEIVLGLRKPVIRSARVVLPTGLTAVHQFRLPALRLGQEIVLTGEVSGPVSGELLLTGRLERSDYRLAVPLRVEPSASRRNPFVSALFARERIQLLLGAPDPAAHRAEIIQLSVTYRTMSPYASFLVLENDEMFRRFGIARSQNAEPALSFGMRPDQESTGTTSEQSLFHADDALFVPAPDLRSTVRASGREGGSHSTSSPASAPPASPPPAPKAKKASGASGAEQKRAEQGLPDDGDIMRRPSGPTEPWVEYPGAYARRRSIPRAHLSSFAADDVWRTWAAADLAKVRAELDQAPDSRSRMEVFVKRHLAQGRFLEAAEVARRFVELDPDYLLAQDLLAQTAVVSGDHEQARRMLDVQVETNPLVASLHLQAAHAFENAGDAVRACAHYRSSAELEPLDTESVTRAMTCWGALLGQPTKVSRPPPTTKAEVPQLRVEVTCDPGTARSDCPAPVVVAPDGRVISPWTPGLAPGSAGSVGLEKVRSGTYFVLLLGGAPGVRGQVALMGRHERTNLAFVAGGLRTVAKVDVAFY